MPCTIQRDDYEILDLNRGWRPTGAVDPAVQPVDVSIRAAEGRNLRYIRQWSESPGDQ
jgi:hypothetical protein